MGTIAQWRFCWLSLALLSACREPTSPVDEPHPELSTTSSMPETPALSGVAAWSDQELAERVPYLDLSALGGRQNCSCTLEDLRFHECSAKENQSRPEDRAGFLHLRYDGQLHASLCSSAFSCRGVQVTRSLDSLNFAPKKDPRPHPGMIWPWGGGDRVTFRQDPNRGFVGTYYTARGVVIEDYSYDLGWVCSVQLLPDQKGPSVEVRSGWAMEPMRMLFDQPVRCDSIQAQVKDPSGVQVSVKVKSACDQDWNQFPASLVGMTSYLELWPQTSWGDEMYQVQLFSALGASNKSAPAQTQMAPIHPSASSISDLDFEGDTLVGWFDRARPKAPPVCALVERVNTPGSHAILAASGKRFLSCATNFSEGPFGVRAQLRVPTGAKRLVFSAASLYRSAAGAFELANSTRSISIRVAKERILLLGAKTNVQAPEVIPGDWTGWHEVSVDLPEPGAIVEFNLDMEGCPSPDRDCKVDVQLALDNFRFE